MTQATVKRTFLKLLPRRFVPDTEITSVGGNDYETSFIPIEPEAVYQAINETTFNSLSFTYADGVTTFTTTTPPADNIFADYPLYFTTGSTQYEQDDPVASTGGIKEWLPRLSSNFAVSQESKDLLNGVLTVSTSTANLINEDFELNQYLTKYDNYFNVPFNAYAAIGDTIYKLSNGIIASFAVSGKTVRFRLKSQNKLYERIANLGNVQKYWKFNQSDFPSGNSKDFGSFITNTRGLVSVAPSFNDNFQDLAGTARYRPTVSTAELIEGKYVSSTQYLIGVSRNPFPADFEVDVTYNGTDPSEPSAESYTIDINYVKYFFLGCRVTATTGGGVTSFPWPITSIDYGTGNCVIVGPSGLTKFRLGPAWITNTPFSVATYGDALGMPTNDLSFSSWRFQTETTTNGETLIYLTNTGLGATFDRNNKFFSVIMCQDSEDQTTLAQELIESSGLSIDASEFATAQTEANNKLVMTLPVVNDSILRSAGFYLERIAKSNNGLFYINDQTEEAGYKIVNENLSGIDWTVTSTEILDPEITPNIEYQDKIDTISTTNQSFKLSNYLAGISNDATSTFGKFFNQIENNLEDVNDNLSVTNASNEKIDRLKEPAYFYKFRLKTDDYFTMQIGDIVKVNNVDGRLLNTAGEIELLIVSIAKSAETLEVTGYEFRRIS